MKKLIILVSFLSFCRYLKPDLVDPFQKIKISLEEVFNQGGIGDREQEHNNRTIDDDQIRNWIEQARREGNHNLVEAMHRIQLFNQQVRELRVMPLQDIIRFLQETMALVNRAQNTMQ